MSDSFDSILVRHIRDLMDQEAMSQQALADLLDTSQPNVNKILNQRDGRHFTLEQLIAISQHFKVSLDELVDNNAAFNTSTPRRIAEFLTVLLSNGSARFTEISVDEEVHLDTEEAMIHDHETNQYLAVYFPNYEQIPENTPEEEAEEQRLLMEMNGNETKMIPVNNYLRHFHEILNVYHKGLLAEDTFDEVVKMLLDRLED